MLKPETRPIVLEGLILFISKCIFKYFEYAAKMFWKTLPKE